MSLQKEKMKDDNIKNIKNSKNKWKKISDKTLNPTNNILSFTDDDKDLMSDDLKLNKKKKPKLRELEKPESKFIHDLSENQKQIIQKNSIIKERLLTIDKILDLYPNLKKDKRLIINNILGKQEVQKKNDVLEKLEITNKSIYKDSHGNLMDTNVNLTGFWTEKINQDKQTTYKYYFFDDIKKIKNKIILNKKNINKI